MKQNSNVVSEAFYIDIKNVEARIQGSSFSPLRYLEKKLKKFRKNSAMSCLISHCLLANDVSLTCPWEMPLRSLL
jgi:hypothetical protein